MSICASTIVKILDREYRIYGYPDEGWFKLLCTSPSFSEPPLEYLRGLIKKDWHCLDLGANLGMYSLALSQLSNFVIAFEPDHKSFEAFKKTIEANRIINIDARRVAVAECGMTGHFIEDPVWRSSSHFVPDKEGFTLASGLDEMSLNHIEFIKIDIEGSELDALNGAHATLRVYKPIVLMEFNSFAFVHYRDILPRMALRHIFKIFPRVRYFDRHDNHKIKDLTDYEEFLRVNMLTGFVDNLLCSWDR